MISVLIAEDHALVRDGIRTILENQEDLQVVGEARNGREAVTLAAALHPDVVLMDIAMPELNGVEATRAIKAANPRAIVLGLSAYDDDAYVFAMLEAGAGGYLLKSAPGDELLNAIRSVSSGDSVLSLSIAHKVMARYANTPPTHELELEPTLSVQEVEVLRLAAAGLANQAIAQQLGVSPRAIQSHFARIFEKLDVASRTEAVVAALKRGWLRLEQI